MADVTVKQWDEFDGAFGGAFKLVRDGLDVTSFGLAAFDLPAGYDAYPEHDHSHDGQEEVYTLLTGKATLKVDGQDYELTPGAFARVGASETRKLIPGSEGCRVLAMGGTPGAIYEMPEMSKPAAAT